MSKAMSSTKKKPAISANKAGGHSKPVAKYQEKESQETAAQNLVVNAGNKNGKKKG